MNSSQLGQLQFGNVQYVGEYSLDDHFDFVRSPGRMRTAYGWGQYGRRRYTFPEIWTPATQSRETVRFAEIGITSVSGALVGKIRTDVQKNIVRSIEFTIDEKGCADFNIILNELPGFPILPFSIISIKIGTGDFDWYRGELSYKDDLTSRRDNEGYEFRGVGLRNYLTNLGAFTTYPVGSDIAAIVDDIAQTWIQPYSPIIYNEDKILQPSGVIVANEIDLSQHRIDKILDTMAEMAGYNWGVDGDGEFYFLPRETETQKTLFVGYDLQDFKAKLNIQDIRNSIIVQRQEGRGSGGAGWAVAGVYNDDASIKKYGKKELTFQIPGFFGDEEAEIIGENLIADKAEPKLSAEASGFLIQSENDYLPRGMYRFILPEQDYDEIYDDVDTLTDWSRSGSGDSIISIDPDRMVYGAGSLKITCQIAAGDIIQIAKLFNQGRIEKIRMYVRASRSGGFLTLGVGYGSWDQYTTILALPVADTFIPVDWDVSSLDLDIIDSIGIRIDENFPGLTYIWIDKIEFSVHGSPYYVMKMTKSKYKFTPETQSASIECGTLPPKMEDYVAGLFATASELKFTNEVR